MARIILTLLMITNVLAAAAIVVFTFVLPGGFEGSPFWIITKLTASFVVIGLSLYTWWLIGSSRLLLAGLALVMIGAATFAWTMWLAWRSGDLESYMLVIAITLCSQGLMAAVHSRRLLRAV